ncbi:uncharacterized protein LOC132382775 isoform X1 [Hypanus sabinus]|uniref:uncharacterized protein LOC132382775 isoform X1 n=2 Tax=Hypanus sabinus TaxID=79690 RepID=UPI0028C48D3F|nr:uncharacterized protein LOC132382775 isoform X1 [Hypanus sabinus]
MGLQSYGWQFYPLHYYSALLRGNEEPETWDIALREPMNPLLRLPTVVLLCGLLHPSVAPSTDRSTLVTSCDICGGSYPLPGLLEDTNETLNQSLEGSSEGDTSTNASISLNGSFTALDMTADQDGERIISSVAEVGKPGTLVTSSTQAVNLTTKPWPGMDHDSPNMTQPSAAPSVMASPSKEHLTTLLAGPTTVRTEGSRNLPTKLVSGQRYFKPGEAEPQGKTLGIFVGLLVVLILVLGLVYLLYNKSQKHDPFSHQRLYNTDPVLSLDVSMEPPDRFYGSLGPAFGSECPGDRVTPPKALNQAPEGAGDPPSKALSSSGIQLKPVPNSSVKIYL